MRGLALAMICFGISGCDGCKKNEAAADASPTVAPSASSKVMRDETGHLKPRTPRPADNPADLPPQPGQDPDWDLDKTDPAKDYVDRYVRATQRYGDKAKCAELKSSGATVEVAGCAPHESFKVDVGADRLEGKDLKKWPDGSDPGGPRNAPLELDPVPPVRQALMGMQLTPIRFQGYARGAYLVVTLAGWRPPITPNASPDVLKDFATKMCAANNGLPLAFFAGIDRATILRVRCGAEPGARWDRL